MKMDYFKLLASIMVCQLAGIVGSFFTMNSVTDWYPKLIKPEFSPPNWVFFPVWTILYTLMGISLFLVWSKGIKSKHYAIAISLFGIQLFLNSFWSILFFGLKSPFFAFIEIIFLLLSIILTAFYFYRISKPAACLLVPYILWVCFASILNYFIFTLNP